MNEFNLNDNIDAYLFKSKTPSFQYVTENLSVEGFLILESFEDKPLLYVSPLEKFESEKYIVKSLKDFKADIKKYSSLGISFDDFSLSWKEKLADKKLVDISSKIKDSRVQKNIKERQLIQKACEETVKCFNEIVSNWKFDSENSVVKYIKAYALRNDLELAFDPLVASGKNSAVPHHKSSNGLNKGFCVIDFGFKYKGYCADMTRTVFLGLPSQEDINFYSKVLRVQSACLDNLAAGPKCEDLHNFAVEKFEGDSKYFIHSLGHGVGLEVHESPRIGPKSDDLFLTNSCITVEPGLYIEGYGGVRIEDTLFVKDEGKIDILTRASKELMIIDLDFSQVNGQYLNKRNS